MSRRVKKASLTGRAAQVMEVLEGLSVADTRAVVKGVAIIVLTLDDAEAVRDALKRLAWPSRDPTKWIEVPNA
jgi:hypothetical protein